MDYLLSKEHKDFKDNMKTFSEKNVAPLAVVTDETGEFPWTTVAKMAEKNLMGLPFPVSSGGAGKDYRSFVAAVEEISKACASTGVILSTHIGLCSWPIYTYGNLQQKKEYLFPLAQGKKLGAFCLTEPDAGTDAGGIKTTAILKNGDWIINGRKIFITNGGEADIYIVTAATEIDGSKKELSSFIVDKSFEGFQVGKTEKKMGIKGSVTREIIFNNCKVPKANMLGVKGKGLKIALSALNVGRIGIAAQALGIAEGAFKRTIEYLRSRKQFGKSLSTFQGLRFEAAEMATRIEATKHLVYSAAWRLDQGLDISKEAAQAKLYASETAVYVTEKAVQLHGGYGYLQENEVERMMRDAKITEIYEGTSQVQRMVIASWLFEKDMK